MGEHESARENHLEETRHRARARSKYTVATEAYHLGDKLLVAIIADIFLFIISGAAVGFVLLSKFLSMFVELGAQTSLTMRDKQWVGNWWLGFAIFGAICVFWSIWLLGFPKEFPKTKKLREMELCQVETSTKVVGYLYMEYLF